MHCCYVGCGAIRVVLELRSRACLRHQERGSPTRAIGGRGIAQVVSKPSLAHSQLCNPAAAHAAALRLIETAARSLLPRSTPQRHTQPSRQRMHANASTFNNNTRQPTLLFAGPLHLRRPVRRGVSQPHSRCRRSSDRAHAVRRQPPVRSASSSAPFLSLMLSGCCSGFACVYEHLPASP